MSHQAYLEAPYQAAYDAQDEENEATEAFWTEEAAAWAEENPDDIQCALANTDLLQRMARATARPGVPDEVLRDYGRELLELIRDVQAAHEKVINERCIRRAKDEWQHARDRVRDWE